MTWWTDFEKCLADGCNEKLFYSLKKVSVKKACDRKGNGLLHYVSKAKGDYEGLVNRLISVGCDVNMKNYVGDVPLIEAIKMENEKIVKLLIQTGADIEAVNDNDLTPLQQAFIFYSEKKSQSGYEIIKTLVKAGSNLQVNIGNEPILIEAILRHSDEVAILLIQSGALVDVRASLTNEMNTPLLLVVMKDKLDLAKQLIAAGADVNIPNTMNTTCLHWAVFKRNLNMILHLLHAGALVDVIDKYYTTPLIVAIQRENVVAASLLIEAGANVNYTNNLDLSNLLYVFEKLNFQLLKLLLNKGANVNQIHNMTLTPLYFFLYRCCRNNRLIEHGERITKAELDNQIECLEFLLEYNADVNYILISESTVLDLVLEKGQSKFVDILLNSGAVYNYKRSIAQEMFENNTDPSCIQVLLEHTALHQAQDKCDDAWIFDLRLLNEERKEYFVRCSEELELMKASQVGSNVTFFQLLVNQNKYKYTRNDSLVEAMKREGNAKRFPIYWDLLNKRFSELLENQKLETAASKSLGTIFGMQEKSFPVIFDCILSYLNESDLCNLASVSCTLTENASFVRNVEFTRFLRSCEKIYNDFQINQSDITELPLNLRGYTTPQKNFV